MPAKQNEETESGMKKPAHLQVVQDQNLAHASDRDVPLGVMPIARFLNMVRVLTASLKSDPLLRSHIRWG